MGRTLYTVVDSPPGRAVQLALTYLKLDYSVKDVDFNNGEQYSEGYKKMYPQGEIPVLDDDGFVLGESVAINQYLADAYASNTDGSRTRTLYPKEPKERALVNYWLAFHLSTFYRRIHDYYVLPMDYCYPKTEDNLKKLNYAVQIFEDTFGRQKTAYVAGNNVTIADFSLLMSTVVLIANEYPLGNYPTVKTWYDSFAKEHPELWKVAKEGLDALTNFAKNPRDISHLKHPLHPTTK